MLEVNCFPVVFLLFFSVEQVVTLRRAGNSTARFLEGPLVLTPHLGQQKQRPASVSESSFSEKGQNLNSAVPNLQLKVSAAALPDQILGQAHIRDVCFFLLKRCSWGQRKSDNHSAKFLHLHIWQNSSNCPLERQVQVKSCFLFALNFRASYHNATLGFLSYVIMTLF